MEIAKTINDVKQGLVSIDELLAPPGTYLRDVPLDSLKIEVLPSGFPQLDTDFMLLKSNQPELIIVGGRPSHGKSALMFQLALQVSTQHTVHVFSLEMSKEQVLTRLISSMTGRPIAMIQRGMVRPSELAEAKGELAKHKYIIDDRAGLNIYQLCDAARQRKKSDNTKLIVIDYLQLLRVEKGHSKDAEIGAITSSLKELAKELQCPVVVGSQLNRQCEIRGASTKNFKPLLSDLRESGNIEQDADLILLVHRESRYTGIRQGEADILIAKNRNGPVGEVILKYIETQAKFIDEGGGI